MAKRWTHRPDGSTWGDWGDDDELGRINLLTPEKVLEGVREVQAGYECGIGLSDFQDLKQGDIIETFEEREIPRT